MEVLLHLRNFNLFMLVLSIVEGCSKNQNASSDVSQTNPSSMALANLDPSTIGYQFNKNLREHPDDCEKQQEREAKLGNLVINYGYVAHAQEAPKLNGCVYSYASAERNIVLKKTASGLDIVFGINTRNDYGDADPKKSSDGKKVKHCWPHLLVAQDFSETQKSAANLGNLSSLRLNFDATLIDSQMYSGAKDPTFTGHFLFYIKITSLDGKHSFWVGSDIYDARYDQGGQPLSRADFIGHIDGQTKKPTVSLRGTNVVPLDKISELMKHGKRVNFDMQLLPAVSEALAKLGQKSPENWPQNLSNYVVDHFNIGWESPGHFNGKMEIHDFSLNVTQSPKSGTTVHRFRNTRTGDYLFSRKVNEVPLDSEWVYEGVSFNATAESGNAIYRCMRSNQKHFLSSQSDCEKAGNNVGVVFYGEATGNTQVYRCYSDMRDVHLISIDRTECSNNGFKEILELTKISGDQKSSSTGQGSANTNAQSKESLNGAKNNVTEVSSPGKPTTQDAGQTSITAVNIAIYRSRNKTNGDYLYSKDATEVAGNSNWIFEGAAFTTTVNSGIAVYRCLRSDNQKHFTSTDYNCEGSGTNEGLLFYGKAESGTQVFRCYSTERLVHLTTVDKSECEKNGFSEVLPLVKI